MKRLVVCVAIVLWSTGMVLLVSAATIVVRSGSYYFEDATVGDGRIVATVGDRLHVLIEDSGRGTPHTVEIDELGIHSGPLSTSSTYTTPVLERAGTFLLYCKPHQNKGHSTSLVVLGGSAPAPTPVPTAAPTSLPTPAATPAQTPMPTTPGQPGATPTEAAATAARATSSPSAAATPQGQAAAGSASTPAPVPSAGPQAPTASRSEGAIVARSGAREGPASTRWLRSVFVGLLALGPLLALAGLAGWRSRRRSARNGGGEP